MQRGNYSFSVESCCGQFKCFITVVSFLNTKVKLQVKKLHSFFPRSCVFSIYMYIYVFKFPVFYMKENSDTHCEGSYRILARKKS